MLAGWMPALPDDDGDHLYLAEVETHHTSNNS
jgi:hypothetical protein